MEYRDTLLQFITQGRQEEMATWIKSHSHLDRLQIMNEFKVLMEELAEEKGIDMDEGLDQFEDALTDYQEKILDDQLESLKQEMIEKDLEKKRNELKDEIIKIREILIESILCNPPHVKELRERADEIIQLEKKNGIFNPENWEGVL